MRRGCSSWPEARSAEGSRPSRPTSGRESLTLGAKASSRGDALPGRLADARPGQRPGRAGHGVQDHLIEHGGARDDRLAFPGSTSRRETTPRLTLTGSPSRPGTGSRRRARSRGPGRRRAGLASESPGIASNGEEAGAVIRPGIRRLPDGVGSGSEGCESSVPSAVMMWVWTSMPFTPVHSPNEIMEPSGDHAGCPRKRPAVIGARQDGADLAVQRVDRIDAAVSAVRVRRRRP